MFLFSVSSFIDLCNAAICLLSALKLRKRHRENNNELILYFSRFYFIFSAFFLALGISFFFPLFPALVQIFFVTAHLLLYWGIAQFLIIFLRLIGFEKFAYPVFYAIGALGVVIFLISLIEGKDAVLHKITAGSLTLISWSHGGSLWILLLIGIGGSLITFSIGLYFFLQSIRNVEKSTPRRKGSLLGIGFMLLGISAALAFILKAFPFYNFWIVLSAELFAIAGLMVVYRALLYK